MYGMRFYTVAQLLGTSMDWFVPTEDMPDEDSERGFLSKRDIHTTQSGNTYVYDKYKNKNFNMKFSHISTASKEKLEHICDGWLGNKQLTVLYFGSLVNSATSLSTLASQGQVFGTGYCMLNGLPKETALDLWTLELSFNEFGTNQSF